MIGQLPKFNEIVRNIDTGDRHSIDTCTQSFIRALLGIAAPLFSKITLPNISNVYIDNSKLCKQSHWFDNDCQNARQQYINALMHFNRMKSDENRVNMCSKKKIYING